jgi:meiotic recombination protein REC8, fungi type
MLAFGEDDHVLPDAQPFSPRGPTAPAGPVQLPAPTSAIQPREEETSSTAISAPHRRARAAKPLEIDETPGLTNAELRQWNEGYLGNMQEAVAAKNPYKLAHQAKKNAEHWVLGQGIGGVGSGLGQDRAAGPLQMFSGANLLAALTGRESSPAGTKHARSASLTSTAEEEERRVRAREEEGEQVGRGAAEQDLTLAGQDDGVFVGDEMVRGLLFGWLTQS